MIKKVTITTALMAAGLITSLGYTAVAQTNRPAPSPNQSAPAPNQPASSPSRSQLSPLDRQFVMDDAHGGMAEVQLQNLDLQRSTRADVERVGQQMIEEQSHASEELMGIATEKGLTPPATVGPKYEAAMMRLMELSGASFDQAYMNEAGVNSHLESTAVYQRQAALGQDPDLKAFAAKTLPRVQGHLEMAEAMTGNSSARNNRVPTMGDMPMGR